MTGLDHALNLANLGFRVFPLKPNEKTPLVQNFPIVATKEQEQIKKWWTMWPKANIGISTNDLLVVDVDVKGEKNGFDEVLRLEGDNFLFPVTCEQATPTGGAHFIYSHPGGVKQGVDKLGAGLDIRSRGGYIVGAGSVIQGKPYTLRNGEIAAAPKWLVDKCGLAPDRPQPTTSQSPTNSNQDTARDRAIYYLTAEAPASKEGSRNDTTYKVAARVRDLGCSEETATPLLCEWNESATPPLPTEELLTTIRSVYKTAQNPIGVRSADAEFTAIEEAQEPPKPTPQKKSTLYIQPFHEVAAELNETYLIEKLLGPGAMSVVYGESNSGKTFFCLNLALHISMGHKVHGLDVKPGLVAYIAAEGGVGIKKRIDAFRIYYKMGAVKIPFGLIPCSIDLLDPKVHLQELVDLLKKFAADFPYAPLSMLVIDTLSRAMGSGNENAPDDMGAFVRNVDVLRQHTKAHIMVIHHSGKDVAKGARGHSSLRAATDTEIEISGNMAKTTKQRDMEFGPPIGFKLEPVEIGKSKDGKIVSSCVVLHREVVEGADFLPARIKPGSNDEKALMALKEAIARNGQTTPNSFGCPDNTLMVHSSEWRTSFNIGLPEGAGESTKRMTFKRSQQSLIQSGNVGTRDEYFWVIS